MNRDDIQGIVLHGYRRLPFARYSLLDFAAGDARRVLARLVTDVSSCAEPRAATRFHLAFTASGLAALGMSTHVLTQFSREFRQGMAHPERSAALGDRLDEAPSTWEFGGPGTPAVDALCVTFTETREQLAELTAAQARLFERFGLSVRHYDSESPRRMPSEPVSSARSAPRAQRVPLGEFVLGEPDALGERQRGPFVPLKFAARPMPDWSHRERALDFGKNGSYLVLRKLAAEADFERAASASLTTEHAHRALGTQSSLAHRLLRRGRWLSDGLLFIALNASIRRQFEFVQQSHCNEPGPNGVCDPIVGRDLRGPTGESRRFRLRGGAYFFLPSIGALNYLAEPGG